MMTGSFADICKIGVGGVWVQLLEGRGTRARVIIVLRKGIWNAPLVSLFLPTFDDTGSMGSPPRRVSIPLVPFWVSVPFPYAENPPLPL